MKRIEKQILCWITEHMVIFLILASTFLSLLARYFMMDYLSRDMRVSLIPWFEEIQGGGGIAALGTPVGNYNIPYQTLIALMTYIPIDPIYQYKILSIIFDYCLGIIVFLIVKEITNSKLKASISYSLTIIFPTIMMNSALWGQCDSIYTFFCLLAVLKLFKHKYLSCFFAYGIAFAFKLQAVFLLPFFLLIYIWEQKYSILHFFCIPISMIVLSLGGIIQGQPLSNVFSIYADQTTAGSSMSFNYPSIWTIMIENYVRNNEDYYTNLHIYAIVFTVVVLFVLFTFFLKEKRELEKKDYIILALTLVYTCLVFLPKMHERYGYLYIVLGLVYVFIDVRTAPMFFLVTIIDCLIYSNYLFSMTPNWRLLGVLNLINWVMYLSYAIYSIYLRKDQKVSV